MFGVVCYLVFVVFILLFVVGCGVLLLVVICRYCCMWFCVILLDVVVRGCVLLCVVCCLLFVGRSLCVVCYLFVGGS